MSVVLAAEVADLVGAKLSPAFQETPHHELGERLRSLLDSEGQPGYRGDIAATDAWAEELGMRDWYEWRPLDEIR
jgi:hypothetical protein